MPRYYFDLSDGSREPDETGTELPDRMAAEREGVRYLGELLKHEPDRLSHGPLRIDIGGERREKLGTLTVTFVPA